MEQIMESLLLNFQIGVGKQLKIPRINIKQSTRDDIINPGVYFLLCVDDDGTMSAYIGEAENVKERLN